MASKRHVRRKMCGKKRGYPDQASAASQAYHMSRRFGERFLPYRCRYCGKYHIGHARPAPLDFLRSRRLI